MKNKNGFLLAEETLKIVIALICIGFLVYLLASLYFKSKDDKELEFAQASLEKLVNEIDLGEVYIYNPKGWVIVSWPQISEKSWVNKISFGLGGDAGGEIIRPLSCSNFDWEYCLCICDGEKIGNCDKKGVCAETDKNINSKGIKINPVPVVLEIKGGVITKNEFR